MKNKGAGGKGEEGPWSRTSIAAFNTDGHIRRALDVALRMTPVDRQNRERFLRVTSGHAARIYEFRVGFELERPANPRGGRSKWNSTGRSAPLPVSSFYPSPVPFYPSPYPGEPPRRPLNVNDRSPNDEVPPMHNATPFLPPPPRVQSKRARQQSARNLWRSACVPISSIYLFVCPSNLRDSFVSNRVSSKFLCRSDHRRWEKM